MEQTQATERNRLVRIPEFTMIMMIGPSGSGKSTLAGRLFRPIEILSSDNFRAMVSNDQNDQGATKEAFRALHEILGARLRNRRLTVVDATNLEADHRRAMLDIARENDCHTAAVVMNTSRGVCMERNDREGGRNIPENRMRHQHGLLRRLRRGLRKEGIRQVIEVDSPEEADRLEFVLSKSRADLRDLHGPFDIIGDVHGCHLELQDLLEKLGYETGLGNTYRHPEGRKVIFLGDLVDRGPASDGVLMTAMAMADDGSAICVEGNHENKLLRKMQGRNVQVTHGLAETLEQLESNLPEFQKEVESFLGQMNSHYVLDHGNLVVTHAGIKQEYLLRSSRRIRDYCLYGETTGERDEWGLPERLDWAQDYQGQAMVAYGHTPRAEARFVNRTICLGHRLRLRRQPDGAQVPGAGDRERAGPPDLLRERQAAGRRRDRRRQDQPGRDEPVRSGQRRSGHPHARGDHPGAGDHPQERHRDKG